MASEPEASQSVSARDIAAVLAGRSSYDALGTREQAVVRGEWDERMTELRAGLNFEDEFIGAGDTWAESDVQGWPHRFA